jgi:hypothetical protein
MDKCNLISIWCTGHDLLFYSFRRQTFLKCMTIFGIASLHIARKEISITAFN